MAADGASSAFERFNEPEGELVITKDPPRQRALRALMSQNLTPRQLSGFEDALSGFCRNLLDQVDEGEPFDFIDSIAASLPLYVAAALLGVATVDIPRMKTWVAALEDLTRITSAAELEEPGRRFDELKSFLRDQLASKRRAPGNDMMSSFLASQLDGAPAPDAVVLAHVATLMSNGGTTRLLLGSIASLLARHPGQLKLIGDNPGLLYGVIEESLRLMPPCPRLRAHRDSRRRARRLANQGRAAGCTCSTRPRTAIRGTSPARTASTRPGPVATVTRRSVSGRTSAWGPAWRGWKPRRCSRNWPPATAPSASRVSRRATSTCS